MNWQVHQNQAHYMLDRFQGVRIVPTNSDPCLVTLLTTTCRFSRAAFYTAASEGERCTRPQSGTSHGFGHCIVSKVTANLTDLPPTPLSELSPSCVH